MTLNSMDISFVRRNNFKHEEHSKGVCVARSQRGDSLGKYINKPAIFKPNNKTGNIVLILQAIIYKMKIRIV